MEDLLDADMPSYLDYETFLDPSFSSRAFAASLVASTNDPSDIKPDLSAPLSRVLFDIQEIDSHLYNLTTKSAEPLLQYTIDTSEASERLISMIQEGTKGVEAICARLQQKYVASYEAATVLLRATENAARTLKASRDLTRVVQLARQLEIQLSEISEEKGSDLHKMTAAMTTMLSLQSSVASLNAGTRVDGEEQVLTLSTSISRALLTPSRNLIITEAQRAIRDFSVTSPSGSRADFASGSTQTYLQIQTLKTRTRNAVSILYGLSADVDAGGSSTGGHANASSKQPPPLLDTIRRHVQVSVTSSVSAIVRALNSLPTLDKTLAEVTARSQNLVALESVLRSMPTEPSVQTSSSASSARSSPLDIVLQGLETTSLPSFFWLATANSLSIAVQDLVVRGGPSLRVLKASKERLREKLRACVAQCDQLPREVLQMDPKLQTPRSWEREMAVFAGAVIGPLGR